MQWKSVSELELYEPEKDIWVTESLKAPSVYMFPPFLSTTVAGLQLRTLISFYLYFTLY